MRLNYDEIKTEYDNAFFAHPIEFTMSTNNILNNDVKLDI
jgi:hypothetical protein